MLEKNEKLAEVNLFTDGLAFFGVPWKKKVELRKGMNLKIGEGQMAFFSAKKGLETVVSCFTVSCIVVYAFIKKNQEIERAAVLHSFGAKNIPWYDGKLSKMLKWLSSGLKKPTIYVKAVGYYSTQPKVTLETREMLVKELKGSANKINAKLMLERIVLGGTRDRLTHVWPLQGKIISIKAEHVEKRKNEPLVKKEAEEI